MAKGNPISEYRFSRRQFLSSSTTFFGLCFCAHPFFESPASIVQDDKVLARLRDNLLQLVNEERAVEKLPPVAIDDLATRVATKHAQEMAKHNYVSHWNREGLKPYHRYSFAGGSHATEENISAADTTWSSQLKDLLQDTSYLHLRLYQEKPPTDGHRQTILRPQQTHVGFGIALDELRLRVVELFVKKYVELNQVSRKAKPGDSFTLSGKLLQPEHALMTVEVLYEPLPKQTDLSWLREPRPYALPTESVVLRPVLPPPFTYADRQKGVIQVGVDGRFTTPIKLFKKEPGVYTLVCWVKRYRNEKAFPATELCIRAE
jgi:uncharacterized protein YkwD